MTSIPKRYTRAVAAFFSSRWRGDVPLERIFWRDMLLVGTAINVAAALLALLLLATDASPPLAMAIFLVPLPYNFVLYVGVWAAAAQVQAPWTSIARLLATLWLAASILI